MNLRTNCPKCGLDKLSHTSVKDKVVSVKCRNCNWKRELGKDSKKIKDQDYE